MLPQLLALLACPMPGEGRSVRNWPAGIFGHAVIVSQPMTSVAQPRPNRRDSLQLEALVDMTQGIDAAVQEYIDAIEPEHRPLFDRLHRLVLAVHPEAAVVLSYQIPTYKVGKRRLYIGVWKHGVSIYGWQQGREAAFIARHPALKTSKGTIQLRSEDAAGIPDDELCDLVRGALDD
jgi:uncharacterized protein YdhG (YjbR/CyaY superfamily)